MIKVVATAKEGTVVIQDPNPEGVLHNLPIAWTIKSTDASATEMVISDSQLERIQAQLDAQVTAGNLSFTLQPAGLSGITEKLEADNSPVIDYVDPSPILNAGGSVYVKVSNLLGTNQAVAYTTIPSSSTGAVRVNSLLCSSANEVYSVVVTNTGSAGLAVSYSDTTKLLSINLGDSTPTNTVAELVTAINACADATAVGLVAEAVGTTSHTITAVMAQTYLTGGKGDVILATVAGVATPVIGINRTTGVLILNVAESAIATASAAAVQIRSNNKSSQIGVAVAAHL